jgi:hypothetical protein
MRMIERLNWTPELPHRTGAVHIWVPAGVYRRTAGCAGPGTGMTRCFGNYINLPD